MLLTFPKCSKIRIIFNSAFGKYLLATNVISSGVLMGLGDAAEQVIELHRKNHPSGVFDWKRISDMTLVGFMIGLPQHYFYSIMDVKLPGNTLNTVFKKILLDQAIASPICITIFFYGLGLLEQGNFKCGNEELKKKFLSVYVVDWLVWPPSQFINFFFLSPKYRVIYVNGVTMLYDVFLSYIKFIHEPQNVERLIEINNTALKGIAED